MERRTFLGAAAVLAALPADVEGREEAAPPEWGADTTPSTRSFPERTGDMGEVRLPESVDYDGPTINVSGHNSDTWDEHHVEVKMKIGDRRVWFALLPGQAREFAEDLSAAAEYAVGEGGEGSGAE